MAQSDEETGRQTAFAGEPHGADALTVEGIVLRTAVKTLVFVLSGVMLLVSALSFLNAGATARFFDSAGMRDRAAAFATRDFERKARRLSRFTDGTSREEYRSTSYLAALIRAAEYNYKAFDAKPGVKRADRFFAHADFLTGRRLDGSYNFGGSSGFERYFAEYHDEKSVAAFSSDRRFQVYVYNFSADLKYKMFYAACAIADRERLGSLTQSYFDGEMVNGVYGFDGMIASQWLVPRNEVRPHWAVGARIDYILDKRGFAYYNNLTQAFADAGGYMSGIINTEKYSVDDVNLLFYDFVNNDTASGEYEFTNLFRDMLTATERLQGVMEAYAGGALESFDFDGLPAGRLKLQYLWYGRVLLDAVYSTAAMLNILYYMNNGYNGIPNDEIRELAVKPYSLPGRVSFPDEKEENMHKYFSLHYGNLFRVYEDNFTGYVSIG